MSAAKSGNHIYVSGSGNTLSSITTDIGDTTFIEKTASSPDIYTVKGNVARYLRIRNGGTLTIGDPEDYTNDETLEFENLAADRTRFYVDTGGTLLQYGDTTLNFSKGTARPYYSYIYGKVDCLGDGTNNPVWKNYRRIYMYENQNNDTYSDDVWHFEEMTVGSGYTANDYAFYLNSLGKVRNHIFKSITFDKSVGNNVNMYCFSIPYGMRGAANITIEDIDFENTGNYPLYIQGGGIYVKDCTFGSTTSWKIYQLRQFHPDPSNTVRDYGYQNEHFFGQQFTLLDGCTFENLPNDNIVYLNMGAVMAFKDCTWEHDSSDSLQVSYQARALLWTGNTFTGGREAYDVDYDGAIQRVFDLDLTIQDTDSNNLEDAIVFIEQSEGKEKFIFKTKSNGKLENCHDIEAALLTNQHQYGNSKTTDVEYWSDDDNSTYHDVTIYKDGYRPYTTTYVMDQARSATIQLDRIDANATTF